MPLLATTQVTISKHCRERYAERINDDADLEDRIRRAYSAGHGMMKRIRRSCPRHREYVRDGSKYWYAYDRKAVFVCEWVAVGHVFVLTCWDWDASSSAVKSK